MKTNKLFKTALLLLLAATGPTTAWADEVSIPQALGSYITWDKALTNCTVQGENTYVGNTNGDDKYAEFTITNSTAQSYIMTFATGSTSGNTGHLNVVLTNSGSTKVLEAVATVEDTGGWTNFNTVNYYSLEDLPAGTYTLRISVKDRTGYCGNWSKLAFYSAEQYPWPSSSDLNLQYGSFTNATWNEGGTISYIKSAGASIDNLLAYNGTEDYYALRYNIDNKKRNAKVSITVTDVATGTVEINNQGAEVSNGDRIMPLASTLTKGWKKIRLDFTKSDESSSDEHLFNYSETKLTSYTYDALPLTGTATLNLNQSTATFTNCSYESGDSKNNIGNVIGTRPSADNYYVNNTNKEAYYDVYANIPWYKSETQLKVTVTDLVTGTEEATGTSTAITSVMGDIHFALNNPISSGCKRIRIDFISGTTGDYLINVKNISFYKRSLNEAYDYTPVAADGVDVVLTRNLSANKWSTIMLPFDRTAAQLQSDLGVTTVTLAAFTSFSDNTLNFSSASSITANTPYMIKVSEAVSGAKTINGVNIVTTGDQYVEQNGVRFQGVYASTKMAAGDYFFSNNNLYKAIASTKPIKPFRAYFKDVPAGARLMFFDETTGISEVMGNTEKASGIYYDLQGRRIAQPTKGLYIVNGKKVVLK